MTKVVNCVGHTKAIEQLGWSPSHPDTMATASTDKTVRIWDARGSGKATQVWNTEGENINMCWHPDGNAIAGTLGLHILLGAPCIYPLCVHYKQCEETTRCGASHARNNCARASRSLSFSPSLLLSFSPSPPLPLSRAAFRRLCV